MPRRGSFTVVFGAFLIFMALTGSAHAYAVMPVCVSPDPDSIVSNLVPQPEKTARHDGNGCPAGFIGTARSGTAHNSFVYMANQSAKANWALHQFLVLCVFYLAAFALGRQVEKKNWNANYTRKALGAIMIVVPIILGYGVPYEANRTIVAISFLTFLVALLPFAAGVRNRVVFFRTAFAAMDRPEDRPHTLTWFATAYVVSSLILIYMMWWGVPQQPAFVIVALIAVAIGDLIAGLIGYRFGKRHYETRALLTGKTYTRTLEGSACLFIITLLAVLLVSPALTQPQFWIALLVLPAALTVAEAKSPRTWDEPVMFGTATLLSMLIAAV